MHLLNIILIKDNILTFRNW